MQPERKIHLLRAWLYEKIDHWPKPFISFDRWLTQNFPREIPGTPQYVKRFATHCFYCNRKFGGKINKTIDHWIPKSKLSDEDRNRYAICCEQCNSAKANNKPEVIIRNCTRAINRDERAFGLHGRRLRIFYKRMTEIFNDNIYDVSQRVYYKSQRGVA